MSNEAPRLLTSESIPPRHYQLRGINKKTGQYETIVQFETRGMDVFLAISLLGNVVENPDVFINPTDVERELFNPAGFKSDEDRGDMSGTEFLR